MLVARHDDDNDLSNWTLTGTNTLGQSAPGSKRNVDVLYILRTTRTGNLPSDCLVSYQGHSLRKSYPYAEM